MATSNGHRQRSATADSYGDSTRSSEMSDMSMPYGNRPRPTNRSIRFTSATIREETSAEIEGSSSSREENGGSGSGGKRIFFKSESSLRLLVWIVKLLMMGSVLVCLVLSKLTVVQITGMLYHLQSNVTASSDVVKQSLPYYWMLFLAVMIPDAFTWVVTLFTGVLMNRRTHPWPSKKSLILGIGVATTEAVSISFLLFAVMPSLPPVINLFIVSGLFSIQGLRNLFSLFCFKRCRQKLSDCWTRHRTSRGFNDYRQINEYDGNPPVVTIQGGNSPTRVERCLRVTELVTSFLAQLLGLGMQFGGLVAILVLVATIDKGWWWFGFLLFGSCLLLSACWCDQIQWWTFGKSRSKSRPHQREESQAANGRPGDSSTEERREQRHAALAPTARLTMSFIASSIRLVLYPFISYVAFRYLYMYRSETDPDPWAIHLGSSSISEAWNWSSHEISVFLVHCICSLLAFILSGFACYMTIHRAGLAIPTLLSTPVSLAIYFISSEQGVKGNLKHFAIFPFQVSTTADFAWDNIFGEDGGLYHALFGVGIVLWVGQLLVSTMYLLQKDNAILARYEDMFVRPHYNSAFLEQYLILNRRVSHRPRLTQINPEGVRTKATVFICSTMYRENSTEMTQMLKSIGRIAKHASRERERGNPDDEYDTFESHIFFDGGCKGDQPTEFAIQLLGLVPEALKDLGVTLKKAEKFQTPYGYRFTWYLKEVSEDQQAKGPDRVPDHSMRARGRAASIKPHSTLRERDFLRSVLAPQLSQLPNDEGEWMGMPFVIHLKDNSKVKNKKRWSQVMYMKYIIEHRILENMHAKEILNEVLPQRDSMTLDNTYILTTDADIDFQAESALVLLDMLARNPRVGAVCARTHPLGYGPLYWYQIFDYAIGHWLLKAAEHILGSVLCCPGCFSVFRCRALRDCLKTYSEEVTDAVEFLTKDMGEDRWLSTLLVKNGWKLEYCAISNDHTYCPNEFDEFFKQRRRWIPSTIANLWLLISDAKTFTQRNPAITYPFVLFQALIIFSTVISPATVILLIAYAMESSFHISSVGPTIVLVLVSVGYGFVCVFSKSQQLQLDVAKVLTFAFSVVMAMVVAGLIKDCVTDFINYAAPNNTVSEPTTAPIVCTNTSCNANLSVASSELVNSTAVSFSLPISPSTMYLSMFAIIFTSTALLHINEFVYIFHFVWYLLGLPAGYLLLLIYSIANLNNRSWGTREKAEPTENLGSVIWSRLSHKLLQVLHLAEEKKKKPEEGKKEEREEEERLLDRDRWEWDRPDEEGHGMGLEEYQMPCQYGELRQWLERHDSEAFYNNFVRAGYTQEWYIAGMTEKDLEAIGVRPAGFVRHLAAAIKEIKITPISPGIPKTVREWIIGLKMSNEPENYVGRFYRSGYKERDVENLSRITDKELQEDMQVTKPAHLKRFRQALSVLREATHDEERNQVTEELIHSSMRHDHYLRDDPELAFWMEAVDNVLRPIPEGLKQSNQLQASLRQLRNSSLVAMLLVNIIWMTLLLTLTIDQLTQFGFPDQVVGLLFLIVYGIIVIVQFLAMLVHRATTLAHYMARLNRNLRVSKEENLVESISNQLWASHTV